MEYAFHLPDIGEGLAEAEVVKWLVPEGAKLQRDELFVVLQTDKAEVEMPAPVAGALLRRGAEEGSILAVGAVLAVFEVADAASIPPDREGHPGAAAGNGHAEATAVHADASDPTGVRPVATPAVRRRARELGLDLSTVRGSGERGRILDSDLEAAASSDGAQDASVAGAPPAASVRPLRLVPTFAGAAPEPEVVPFRGLRRRTAETMAESWRTIPHMYGHHEVDVTDLVGLWHAERGRLAEAGVELTLTPFLVKACALALLAVPEMNAQLDAENEQILLHRTANVGVATARPDGLIVPVVKHAESRSIVELAVELTRLTGAARDHSISRDDLSGGTFTISNYGAVGGGTFGGMIIRPPEAAIAGFGRIVEAPVVRAGDIVIRNILPFSLGADHRLVDGEQSIRFALEVRRHLERPVGMLLGAV